MNILDLQKRLHAGTININTNGHDTNDWVYLLDNAVSLLYQYLQGDEHWLVDEAKRILFRQIEYKKTIKTSFIGEIEIYCFECDRKCMPVLLDKDNIILIESCQHWYTEVKKSPDDYEWKKREIPDIYFSECVFSPIRKIGMMTSEINIPTGNLVLANYFEPEEIYTNKEKEYKTGYSINSNIGRYHLMQYLATKDVGYGQMGNMAIELFVKRDGTEIVIANNYHFDKNGKERKTNFKGFKHIGSINLGVWRWQCADQETLEKYKKSITDMFSEHNNHFVIPVQSGKWRIEHYYNLMTEEYDNGHPYSRLKLIQV